jgi:hypothetical protein
MRKFGPRAIHHILMGVPFEIADMDDVYRV